MTSLPSTYVFEGTSQAGVRTLQAFADLLFSTWERWVGLNLDMLRATYSSGSGHVRALADASLSTPAAAYGDSLGHVAEYLHGMRQLCLDTHAEVARLNVDTLMESTASMPAFLAQLGTTSGPQAAHGVVALMQSAMHNGSAIYGRLLETGCELADSNLAMVSALQPRLPVPQRSAERPGSAV